MRHIESRRADARSAFPLLAFILCCALAAGGCASRTSGSDLGDLNLGQEEKLSYVPDDDGIPLSSTELAALNSTGELDRNLSREAMDDIVIQYKYFLHKARPTFERFLRRAELYLPYAKQVFRERGLPEELAYIAMIESGYNPMAVSHAGAAGPWQFMPFTGKKYGLTQDWWADERHDPYKATHAAAAYFAKLHGDFKDWHLAVAAYNAGEGKIGRALEGTGAGGFFELTRMNHKLDEKARLKDETRQYVPRFLAVCKLMRNLDKLGFIPPDPALARRASSLSAAPGTDLRAAARAAGMDWAEFSAWNPAFRRHVSPEDRACALYVPEQSKENVALFLADASARGAGARQRYTVAKGDSWQRISARSGVPVGMLKRGNKGKKLVAGAVLHIPGGGLSPAAAQIARATPASVRKKQAASPPALAAGGKKASARAAASGGQGGTYRVRQGDTMWSIARKHNVPPGNLMRLNNMDASDTLRAGAVVRIAAN